MGLTPSTAATNQDRLFWTVFVTPRTRNPGRSRASQVEFSICSRDSLKTHSIVHVSISELRFALRAAPCGMLGVPQANDAALP
jgi:hypothetical protein